MACDCTGLGSRLRDIESGNIAETEIDLGFEAHDWAGTKFIEVIRSGTPVLGQIGPHTLPPGTYNITVFRYESGTIVREVGVGLFVDRSNGLITMVRSTLLPAFGGRIVINWARAG
jgi:hypothetical protein